MIIPMKTTLIIPDHLVRELRKRAALRGETLSTVVAEALHRGLQGTPVPPLTPLPTHRMGRPRVNVADRDALFRAMEGR